MKTFCIGWVFAALSSVATATEVTVIGLFPNKAVVVIDGAAPRTVGVGQRASQGVALLAVTGETATFEIDGRKRTLAMGTHYAPSPTGTSQKAILTAGQGGHFSAEGRINGGTVRFLLDTGATSIALPAAEARRLGINYLGAPRGLVQTANGLATVHKVTLDTVTVGSITLSGVEAMILEGGLTTALLGMSFLSRTNMQREGDTLTLLRRF